MSEEPGRWGERTLNLALNLALLALGVVVMALLYALVSQSFGATDSTQPSTAPAAARDTAAPSTPDGDDILQVGVRNGCGEEGLAAATRGFLVRAGFDVVEVGNYSSFDVDSSMVIDRVGNRAAALRVARALGIPARRVHQDISPEYHLDASVVLGRDYATLRPFRDEHFARTFVP